MSKKIFLPQEWENVPSEPEQTVPSLQTHIYHETATDLLDDVERIVREIETQGIDLAP